MSKSLPLKKHNRLLFFVRLTSCPSDSCSFFMFSRHIRIQYKGKLLEQEYFADFVCYDKIIIELKALKEIHDVHKAQTYNYLRATDYALGLLMNFGEHSLVVERIVNFNSSRINSELKSV